MLVARELRSRAEAQGPGGDGAGVDGAGEAEGARVGEDVCVEGGEVAVAKGVGGGEAGPGGLLRELRSRS